MRELFLKYIDNQCTAAEIQSLTDHFGNPAEESVLRSLILEVLKKESAAQTSAEQNDLSEVYLHIRAKIIETKKARVIPISARFYGRAAAAAIFILALAGTYYILTRTERNEKILASNTNTDISAPDKTRAAITLADGSRVYLDSIGQGEIANQMNVRLVKGFSGELIYISENTDEPVDIKYNTLYNPRGSRPISLKLSDGTQVWLNSDSRLRYPVAFVGKDRIVDMSGEAYFEVAKDPTRKFRVQLPDEGNVEVLGTHFNINAYEDDDQVYTTLLEGSVKMNTDAYTSIVLKPGEQAIRGRSGQLDFNQHPHIEEVMAWKNGRFVFGEFLDLPSVMKQIARWYDLEVEFREPIQTHIGGSIKRDVPVSMVFQMLEETGAVHFELRGRKVTVMTKK